MKILEFIKDQLKLDFTSLVIQHEFSSESSNPFDISARDFLRFAKSDYKENTKKGNINALTNAKRAIDCQIDSVFTIFGIKYDEEIPKSSNKIIELTNFNKTNLAHKLKLIQALDFAPSGLVSKMRTLRNKLEHDYKIPNKEEVKEAIELAELFIKSIESHVEMIPDHYIITDKFNIKSLWNYKNHIDINFCHLKKEIETVFYVENQEIGTIMLNQNNEEYYAFIKLMNNISHEIEMEDAIKVLLKMIKHPIPEKNIKLEIY